ncbi:MAG: helix-turn-helix transcriptional regulator [Crocinitomicaceae bacterium]
MNGPSNIKILLFLFLAVFSVQVAIAQDLPSVFKKQDSDLNLYELKYYYLESGKPLDHCDSLAKVYSELLIRNDEFYKLLLNELARVTLLTQAGLLKEALGKIEFFRKIPEFSRDNRLKGYLNTCSGNVFFGMGNPVEARDYYQVAFESLILTSDSVAIKGGFINLGNTYAIMNVPDSAMIYYYKALKMEDEGVDAFHFSLQNNLGHILSGQNKIEKGIIYYEQLVFEDKERLVPSEFTTASLNLGRSYNILGRYHDASLVLNEAVKIALDAEVIRVLPSLLDQLSFAYNKSGKVKDAYETLKVSDSIEHVLSHQDISDLKNELEMKHQKELFLSEKATQEEKLLAAHSRKLELVVLSIVLGILLLVIAFLYGIKRRKNQLLVKQNLKLAEASRTKKTELKRNYQHSTVPEELKKKIKEALEQKKLYTDAQLSIEKLAKKINSNRTYVSEGINEIYSESFRSVVNKLRIEEARSLLINPDYENYSIEGVAVTVGYRNISSFNSAFKRETGITPSYFRRSYLKSTLSIG